MEQRNHPEGVGGLHPQTAERTTASPRDGGEAEEAGDHQPLPAAPHPGEEGGGGGSTKYSQVPTVTLILQHSPRVQEAECDQSGSSPVNLL